MDREAAGAEGQARGKARAGGQATRGTERTGGTREARRRGNMSILIILLNLLSKLGLPLFSQPPFS